MLYKWRSEDLNTYEIDRACLCLPLLSLKEGFVPFEWKQANIMHYLKRVQEIR